jgi:hypothetical protein
MHHSEFAAMRVASLCFMFMLGAAPPLRGQDLEAADVRVTLDSALHIANRAAATAFPELSNYLLYSITPRVLKADPGGLHWQVRWQARDFPHRRWLVVRVYMKDGHTRAEREGEGRPPSSTDASPSR